MICLHIKSRPFGCRVLFWVGFSQGMVRKGIPRVYTLFILFVAQKGIPSCVLFRGMVRKGIPRICISFGSTERNSELCSLPQKGSEQYNGSLLLFLFHGTEFRVVFSSAEGFGTEFRDFLFRGTTGIPSEITICSAYSVFRGIIFLSEIPNPSCSAYIVVYLNRNSQPKTAHCSLCSAESKHQPQAVIRRMDDSQVTAFVNENLISGRILTGNGKTYYTGSRIRGQPTAAVFHPCLDNSSSLSLTVLLETVKGTWQ
jgi:hypothetical protein